MGFQGQAKVFSSMDVLAGSKQYSRSMEESKQVLVT